MLTTPGAGPITSHRIGSIEVTYASDSAETVGLTRTEQTALNRHCLVGVGLSG